MPRVPAIYEAKVSWKLEDDASLDLAPQENYSSMAGHEDAVRRLFAEEKDLGFMYELTDAEAAERFRDRLYIASLGVVVEQGGGEDQSSS